jgi:chromosome segregation ATPase
LTDEGPAYADRTVLCQGKKSVIYPAVWISSDRESGMKVAEWTRVVEQLRESIDQTAAEAARHEQALESPLLTSDLSDERHVSWQRALERVGERFDEAQARVDQAERLAGIGESELTQQQEELTNFLRNVERVRGQLANLPPAV